jgi:hypothetical protein
VGCCSCVVSCVVSYTVCNSGFVRDTVSMCMCESERGLLNGLGCVVVSNGQGGVSSSPHLRARQDHRPSADRGSARQIFWPEWDQGHRLRPRWPALVRHATRWLD